MRKEPKTSRAARFFRSTEFRLFLTFFIIYACFAHFINWNENSRLDLTLAMVDDHTFSIDNYFNNTGDRAYYKGHYYSDKEPGMSFLAVPWYVMYRSVFGKPRVHHNLDNSHLSRSYLDLMLLVIIGTSALAGALSVVLIYRAIGQFTDDRVHRLLITLVYGLGTLVLIYSRLFMNHVVAMLLAFLSFYLLFLTKKAGKDRTFLAGLVGGFAITTELATMAIVLGDMVYLYTFNKRKLLRFSAGLIVGLLPFFIYNIAIFRNPFELTYFHMDKAIWGFTSLNGQFRFRILDALNIMFRLLFYPYKGIFFFSPILIFSFLGFRRMYRKYRTETILILSFFVTILIYNSQLNIWSGGSSFGARHFVILIPFLMLPLAYSFREYGLRVLAVFIVISIIFNVVGMQAVLDDTYTKPAIFNERFYSFSPIANPIFDRYIPMFIHLGPDSRLLFSAFGVNHTPFLNVEILLLLIALIWAPEIFRAARGNLIPTEKNGKKKKKPGTPRL